MKGAAVVGAAIAAVAAFAVVLSADTLRSGAGPDHPPCETVDGMSILPVPPSAASREAAKATAAHGDSAMVVWVSGCKAGTGDNAARK